MPIMSILAYEVNLFVAMGLGTSPPARCYLDCFNAIFCHQTFWLGDIQK
jgi:hypothetical protein